METISLEIIGFSGFYQGIFDWNDNEYDAIWELKSGNSDYEQLKTIDQWGFCVDYRQRVTELFAKEYVKMLHDILGIDVKMVDCELKSPTEYNFDNDSIKVLVEADNAISKRIVELANDSRYHKKLATKIRENHTNTDGYWSFMSNDICEWMTILQHSRDDRYLSCMIWYLMEIIDEQSTSSINERMWNFVTECTDLHTVSPQTGMEQEEWQLYEEYGDRYIEYAKNHHCNTMLLESWRQYKEQFLKSLKR